MSDYNHKAIEKYWQLYWKENSIYKTEIDLTKPKYYVLDMFPYPSGAGLHVGHPLGYIASDILSRYKRHKGFNVLHPMGYDSFGLPAEQYAIQTGQHPAITTDQNIKRFREQLDVLGFSYDWDRELRTSDPAYYKWTQWIFMQIYHSWYNNATDKAEHIDTLIFTFNKSGNQNVNASCDETKIFSADEWNAMSESEQQLILMNYRIAYLSDAWVNWCPQLGSVLANDEIKDGVSERGGFPVERKLMKQWSMRITAYAQRLLDGLENLDWSESIKESQRNWIGRSEGCSLKFAIHNSQSAILVFTTRPDTIFGATFITLAPEHDLVNQISTDEYKDAVTQYVHYAKSRSERERQADVKRITGQFTGAYSIHPFTQELIPIWIGEYVLAGYGTGAVMAVPAHDSRDYAFAKHFNLSIKEVISGGDISVESYDAKDGICINSDFLNGLSVKDALKKIIQEIENRNLGKGKIQYRLRDAAFGRQRYWGEPIPVYYKDGIPYTIDESELPLLLPEVDKYQPTTSGEPPLARAENWKYKGVYDYEHTTMPGWAGSSWYYLRYMDVNNSKEFASSNSLNYWQDIDFYLGGAEHATGHLLYVRFWTKFLKDFGYLKIDEPAKKLVNQGMIQGVSQKAYKRNRKSNILSPPILLSTQTNILASTLGNGIYGFYYSSENVNNAVKHLSSLKHPIEFIDEFLRNEVGILENVDISFVNNSQLNIQEFIKWRPENTESVFVCSGGYWFGNKFHKFLDMSGNPIDIHNGSDKFYTISETEKMSKSKYNVVNPEDIVEQHGADCLRMYEMFLGPLEQHKPWNTNGISGVAGFLKKIWRLYENAQQQNFGNEKQPDKIELKAIHKTIKKISFDIEHYSFNTSVAAFMICVNELTDLKCSNREILQPLAILLSPFAPHIAEEFWKMLGNESSITQAAWPQYDEQYIKENSHDYPVSINGKVRFKMNIALDLQKEDVEKTVMQSEEIKKYLNGDSPKKVIVVHGKIVNVVL